MELINMQGRFALWFDYNANTYYFSTLMENSKYKRTVTKDEAETLQRILMCGYIPKEEP